MGGHTPALVPGQHTKRKRATAIVLRDGKVLLVRDKGKHHFSLPGGGVRKGESPVDAAARELREEVGLKTIKKDYLFTHHVKANEHEVVLIEAMGEVRLKGNELSEFMWWDGKQQVLIYPHVTGILNKFWKDEGPNRVVNMY